MMSYIIAICVAVSLLFVGGCLYKIRQAHQEIERLFKKTEWLKSEKPLLEPKCNILK